MKAAIATSYGPPEVLKIKNIEKPTPKSNEVLIHIRAASLNSGDVRIRSLNVGEGIKGVIAKIMVRLLFGLTKPKKILGTVFAGEITEIGDQVTLFKKGDKVVTMTGFRFGAFAEYCSLPDTCAITLKPEKASFEEACAFPFGGNTSLYFLEKAGIKKGSKVLVYGSTGSVGTSALQIAKHLGAEVHAVSGPDGIAMSKELGATKVYNYKTTTIQDIKDTFDIVFDAVGKTSKKTTAHLLRPEGQYVTVGGTDVAKGSASYLKTLTKMYDEGSIKPTIDKVFDLDQIVKANRYVDTGHKKGNVIIRISESK